MIGDTVRPSVPARPGGFGLRLRWAIFLALPVLLLLYLPSPFPEILVVAAAGVMAWEWQRLCAGPSVNQGAAADLVPHPEDPKAAHQDKPALILVGGAVLAAVLLAAFGYYAAGLWLAVLAGLLMAVLARLLGVARPVWLAVGVPYVAIPCIAFLWLRLSLDQGRELIFWLLFVIWATDSFAYLAGKSIGGPKLAPRISPKKTWSGLLGGMAGAALVGGAGSLLLPGHPLAPLVIGGAVLAVVAQIGDLMESAVKRHFAVKDSSALIPGHGGLLDRVDGLLTAAVALAALLLWRGVNL